MKVFNYDSLTGELVSEEEASPDPMEDGKFLIPIFATLVKPSAANDNQTSVFNPETEKWITYPDYRGTVYWTAAGVEVTITELGVSKPSGVFSEQVFPPLSLDQVRDLIIQEYNITIDKLLVWYPKGERLTFPLKKAAADAFLAGTATPEHLEYLEILGRDTGVAVQEGMAKAIKAAETSFIKHSAIIENMRKDAIQESSVVDASGRKTLLESLQLSYSQYATNNF